MLRFLCRLTLLFMLLVLGVAWIGCTKRTPPVQTVNIPDANLRSAIERDLNKPAGAAITNAKMATLTRLEGARANIRDLTGPEFAINHLTELHLRNNQLSDLSPLGGLTNLEALDISDNQLSDLSPPHRINQTGITEY